MDKTERKMRTTYENSELFQVGECPYCWALIAWESRFDHLRMAHPTIPVTEQTLKLDKPMGFKMRYLREEY